MSSGEYQWTVPLGLDIINDNFPPWEILGDCDGTQTLSGAFWVDDAAVNKRYGSNSIDKKAQLPDLDVTVGTSMSSTSVGGDSSSSMKIGKVTSTTIREIMAFRVQYRFRVQPQA